MWESMWGVSLVGPFCCPLALDSDVHQLKADLVVLVIAPFSDRPYPERQEQRWLKGSPGSLYISAFSVAMYVVTTLMTAVTSNFTSLQCRDLYGLPLSHELSLCWTLLHFLISLGQLPVILPFHQPGLSKSNQNPHRIGLFCLLSIDCACSAMDRVTSHFSYSLRFPIPTFSYSLIKLLYFTGSSESKHSV